MLKGFLTCILQNVCQPTCNILISEMFPFKIYEMKIHYLYSYEKEF